MKPRKEAFGSRYGNYASLRISGRLSSKLSKNYFAQTYRRNKPKFLNILNFPLISWVNFRSTNIPHKTNPADGRKWIFPFLQYLSSQEKFSSTINTVNYGLNANSDFALFPISKDNVLSTKKLKSTLRAVSTHIDIGADSMTLKQLFADFKNWYFHAHLGKDTLHAPCIFTRIR